MAGKTYLHHGPNLYALVERFLEEHPEVRRTDGSSLYIVPDAAAPKLRSLKIRYFLQSDEQSHPDAPFLTYSRFLTRLATRLNLPGIFLNFNQRLVLLNHAVAEVRSRLHFFRFPTEAAPATVLTSLLHFFDALRLNQAENVLQLSQQLGLPLSGEDHLRNDLYHLYSKYRQLLGERYLDEAALLQKCLDSLSPQTLHRYFPELQIVVWEDPTYFAETHRKLVQRLRELGIQQHLLFQDGRNLQIFEDQEKLRSCLQSLADHREPYGDPENFEKALFNLKHSVPSGKKKIFLIDEVDRLREVQQLAGEIRRLTIDEGLAYNEIAISSPQLQHYLPLLEMLFSRFRIPYQVKESLRLENSLIVQHLFLPLQLVAEDYRLEVLLNLLRSPFFNYRQHFDELLLQTALNGLRIRSGKEELLQQIQRAKHYYSHRASAEEDSTGLAEVYQRLEAVLRAVFEDAAFFEQEHSAEAIYRYLLSLIEKHRMSRRILADGAATPDSLFPNRHEHLEALRRLLDLLHFWQLTSPKRRFTARQLQAEMEPLLKLGTYRPRRPDARGVQIIPFSQVSTPGFRVLFLLGMEDGVFPTAGSAEFVPRQLLPERLRAFAGERSPSQERRLFLRILHLPVERLYFSYPRYHQESPVLPSIFLRELIRIQGGNLPRPERTPLFQINDLLEKAARQAPRWLTETDTTHRLAQLLDQTFPEARWQLLRHQLTVAAKRRLEAAPGLWEGNLSTAPAVSRWLQHYYRRAHLSVTQLETFGQCPQIFFFERILRISPEAVAEEFISPLDRGALVHQILFRFYRDFPETERRLEHLLSLAEEELENLPVQHGLLWQLEKDFLIGSPDSPGLLQAFWENERVESANYHTHPLHFEFSFGHIPEDKQLVDPHSVDTPYVHTEAGDSFFFKGKIDRIEVSPEGALLIVDYKTGSSSTFQAMWRGESLQLPIYLQAATHFLQKNHPAITMGGAAYYQLKNVHEISKKMVFCSDGVQILEKPKNRMVVLPDKRFTEGDQPLTLEEFVQRTFRFAVQYIREIRRGRFPHTLKAANCHNFWGECPYLPLCRLNADKQAWRRRASERSEKTGRDPQ